MQLTSILQLALLTAPQISAAPVAGADALTLGTASKLVKRADITPVQCGRKLSC